MSEHPNLDKLELVAHALGDLRGQLVFVGGCAVELLLTDPAPARVTFDVDLVARDVPICRWRYNNLEVDLMPTDARV